MDPTSTHQVLCENCQALTNSSPQEPSWNSQGHASPNALLCLICTPEKQSTTGKIPKNVVPIPEPLRYYTQNGLMRTDCTSCRKAKIQCSRLQTTASKCTHCLEHDLDCDCRVMRATCQCCKDRWLRCTGNEEICTNCTQYGLECKPYKREKSTSPMMEGAPTILAKGPMDIIDGMKTSRAFDSCFNCQENSMFICDRDFHGCKHCKVNNEQCYYPSFTGTFSYSPSSLKY